MSLTDVMPRVISWASTPIKVTLGETVYAGDLIGFDGTDWMQAEASATAPISARLVALEDGADNDVIEAAPFAVVSSYTGGTAGAQLWLSDVAGKVEEAVTGSLYQKVGFMASATVGFLSPAISEELGVMKVARSTDDARAGYFRLYQKTAAGSGDALRGYHTVLASTAAAGAHGIHGAVSFNAGASVTGLAVGVRATLDFATNTASPAGTYAALQADSNVGANITLPNTASFIRFADNGSVKLPVAFDFSSLTAGTGNAIETDTGAVGTPAHYLRVLRPGGAIGYICIYDGHS